MLHPLRQLLFFKASPQFGPVLSHQAGTLDLRYFLNSIAS